MLRVAQTRLTHVPGLVLWATTELLLNEYGPLGPIWLQHISQLGQGGQPSGFIRQMIFEMIPEKIAT
jgi:hypothetical protein